MKKFLTRRLWLATVFFLGLPMALPAQIVPRAAIFGGYTFVHNQANDGPTFNLNGWDASLEGGFAPWLGIVADVSQQYGSLRGEQEKQTTALFGPQVSVHGIPRIVPFAHALIGVVHGTNQFSSTQPACVQVVGVTCPPIVSLSTGNAFATALGGGVDVKIAGPIYVRAIQADWLRAHLNPDHQTHLRLSAGIVLRFGGF
jgi:hypothetical protein